MFVTGKHTEGRLFSCLLPHLPAKTCAGVSNANEHMKGRCGHLQPAAKKLCADGEKKNKKRSAVEEQQCVSGNPFPLRSRNTECAFNQPLSALCGCREPTWPNSKLIHFSIDLFDNNRGKKFSLLALQSEPRRTWRGPLAFSASTGDGCDVMLQHPEMAISGIGFEIALHSENPPPRSSD